MGEVKSKFMYAVNGMEEARKDINDREICILEEFKSLRNVSKTKNTSSNTGEDKSGKYSDAVVNGTRDSGDKGGVKSGVLRHQPQSSRTPNTTVDRESVVSSDADESTQLMNRDQNDDAVGDKGEGNSGVVNGSPARPCTDPSSGAISKLPPPTSGGNAQSSGKPLVANQRGQVAMEDGWVLQQSGRGGRRGSVGRRSRTTGVRGSGRNTGGALKAAFRSVDVFIGRVSNDIDCDGIKNYINSVFNIQTLTISEIEIRATDYKAFKVGVNLNDREALFNADLWPENIIVDKFYNKSKRNYDAVQQ